MISVLAGILLLLPCAMSDGAGRIRADADSALRTQAIWSDDACAELNGPEGAKPQLYASRMPQKDKRAVRDEKKADSSKRASDKGNAAKADAQAKGAPAKAARATVAGSAYEAVGDRTANQIFEHASTVWGSEERMMRILSGIIYTADDAKKDGITAEPYVTSLYHLEAYKEGNKNLALAKTKNQGE